MYASTTEQIREEGRIEGRVEGRTEGTATTLLRLVDRILGPVDEATRERVLTASASELDTWIDRIPTATSAADLFR